MTGFCKHCGEKARTRTMIELIAGGGSRLLTITVHDTTGHERCHNRDTLAEI